MPDQPVNPVKPPADALPRMEVLRVQPPGLPLALELKGRLLGVNEAWVRSVCWRRVPLLGALILFGFPFAALTTASPMLRNLFEIGPAGMALVTPMAIMTGWMCGLCWRIAGRYAAARSVEHDYSAPSPPPVTWVRTLIYSTALALPMLGVAALETNRRGAVIAVGLGGFVAAGVALWGLWSNLGHYLEWADRRTRWLARWMSRRQPAFRDGYLWHDDDGEPAIYPGHLLAVTLMAILAVLYLAGMVIFRPGRPWLPPPTALAYLLQMHMLLVVLLSGMAFFLDRFRLPLLVMVLALSIFAVGTRRPYQFELRPVAGPALPLPPASAPFDGWKPGPGSAWSSTAVVVCASGGGIQSAAWTASVLTWLQEDPALGEEFTRAIRFFSGVSGGSVGVMYFLAAYDPALGAPPPERLEAVRKAAMHTSISEVAWGIVYPDMGRTLLPGSWSADVNRAWAMERAWSELPAGYGRRALDEQWSAWVGALREGKMPGVVFNAFDIVRGDRVLLSNVQIPGAKSAIDMAALANPVEAGEPVPLRQEKQQAPGALPPPVQQFQENRPQEDDTLDVDMDVVTAARLSATFPYVTPISRPRIVGKDAAAKLAASKLVAARIAIADGGYFDNAGLLSAVDWIRCLVDKGGGMPERVKRVVILEIRAFGRQDAAVQGEKSTLPKSWTDAVIGPLQGLMRTRTSTQIARNELDLELLRQVCGDRLRIEHVVFEPQGDAWPLSWHLSSRDLKRLEDQRTATFEEAKCKLLRLIGRCDGKE